MKKKILITGGTGFIGSHLCELCVRKGFKVTSFDRYNTNYSLGNLKNSKYEKDINFIFGDIRDRDSVEKALKGQDIVFHLAALVGIPYSYISPLAYVRTNIEGTYNVLEALKNSKSLKQAIITSTSEVYGTAVKVPINEEHRLLGQSPYSATKIAADNLALSYYHSFDLPIKIIRPFNTFGPRQSHRALIPTIILQASRSKEIHLGNINTTRDFTYVEDTCNAFLELSKSKLFGRPVNVGTNTEIKTSKVAESIIKIVNPKARIKISKSRTRPTSSEVHRLVCNYNLLKKNTNWKPQYSFNEGLKETIKWFKSNIKSIPHNKYYV
tara:strand:+ start:136 stop:1110 length:975 start_codon:yes stop_codon:yes gene_type:complete